MYDRREQKQLFAPLEKNVGPAVFFSLCALCRILIKFRHVFLRFNPVPARPNHAVPGRPSPPYSQYFGAGTHAAHVRACEIAPQGCIEHAILKVHTAVKQYRTSSDSSAKGKTRPLFLDDNPRPALSFILGNAVWVSHTILPKCYRSSS